MSTAFPYTLGSGVLPARFAEEFEAEQHEYLVAAGGGGTTGTGIIGREDTPPMAMAHTLGYIELDTGRKHGTRSDVRWDVPEEEFKSRAYRTHFTEGVIYRVRACPPKNRETLHTEYAKGVLYVTEVLGAYYAEPYLLGLIEEYNKPVTRHSDVLGELTLNKKYEWFEGECEWLGGRVKIRISADDRSVDTDRQIKALEGLWQSREKWDGELKAFAAGKLTYAANEWIADYNYDAEEKLPPVTEESFARSIVLKSLHLNNETSFEAYFDDGGLFAGHTVTVEGDLINGADSADLMG